MTTKQRKHKNAYERERRRLHRLHRFENAARDRGFQLIGGVDEVGRGPLAGPVVAACVVAHEPLMLRGLNDSKVVPPPRRRELAQEIVERVVAYGIGVASVAEIDRLNIYWASVLAMERAIAALGCAPEYLYTDAVRIRSYVGPQEPLIKGDAVVRRSSRLRRSSPKSIATICSRELDREDPRYGFADHKGYATPAHIEALRDPRPERPPSRGVGARQDRPARTLVRPRSRRSGL